ISGEPHGPQRHSPLLAGAAQDRRPPDRLVRGGECGGRGRGESVRLDPRRHVLVASVALRDGAGEPAAARGGAGRRFRARLPASRRLSARPGVGIGGVGARARLPYRRAAAARRRRGGRAHLRLPAGRGGGAAVRGPGADREARRRVLHPGHREHQPLGDAVPAGRGGAAPGAADRLAAGHAAGDRGLPAGGGAGVSRVEILESSFTAGEVSPLLLGRGDLVAYENGAARLRNVFIQPTGGVTRRSGLRYVDAARGPGRLVAFEFNTEQVYLMAFTAGWLDVYRDEAKVAEVAAPWTADQLGRIAWTQSADTLLVTHPEVPPQRITRTGEAAWTVEPLAFAVDGGISRQPFHRFAPAGVTLTPSAVSGTITVGASAEIFLPGHAGTRFRIGSAQVEIADIASATEATATTLADLAGTDPTTDWAEQAFSAARGWPVSIAFHQDRLVLGGSRDLPNRLWLSKSGDLFNFDLGTGLDDEAIEFPILSDQVNAIRAVFSGRHLQVFTSGAEWMVTGDPLTPSSLQVKRQTRVGSPVDRSVPPRDVDGATLFVSRNGRELREFLYADVEQAY